MFLLIHGMQNMNQPYAIGYMHVFNFLYFVWEIGDEMLEIGHLQYAVKPLVEISAMVAYWSCDYFLSLWMQKYQISRDILSVNCI